MPRSRSSGFESIARGFGVLAFAEDAALAEHGIDQGRLAVVDVGDDREITDVVAGPMAIRRISYQPHAGSVPR